MTWPECAGKSTGTLCRDAGTPCGVSRNSLPVEDPQYVITLGEGGTPLLHARNLANDLGLESLYVKEEGLNPTGTFKARGISAAISRAWELGSTGFTMPSAGNAAGAAAAYCARAGAGYPGFHATGRARRPIRRSA